MEERKHKKNRVKDDSKDENKVGPDKTAVDSEVREGVSSMNGDKKRKRKREGSSSDVGNATEERKKKKTKHTDNLVDAERKVAGRKLEEEMALKKDDVKKEKEGKRNKRKEEADGENGGRGDQADKDRRKKKKKKRKHKEDLMNSQETGESEAELGKGSKTEKERMREKKKKKENTDDTPTVPANREEGDDKHGGRSIKERTKKKKKKHEKKNKQEVGERVNDENVQENKKWKKKKPTLPSKQGKRVTFADDVQVFPANNEEEAEERDDSARNRKIVHSKRFSPEEDKLVKEAVFKFIESRDLGEEGLDMVLHCKEHPEVRNCWKEIGSYIPWRPYVSVYHRAHTIFKRSENTTWSPEEYEIIRNFHEKHGPDWKTLAEALGRHRVHVKDTWRRIKLENEKKGSWSQEEYKYLFESVNMDLRMRSLEEKPFNSRHGMLRDNIPWEAISQKLSTRTNSNCCKKWYDQLTSPMVSMGLWADTDDYRLLDALVSLDACSMEDVDWDNLIEHRSGDVCRKRWYQMVNHIGDQGNKSFPEYVDILSNRYCPELIDAREAWDEKLREAAKDAKTDD